MRLGVELWLVLGQANGKGRMFGKRQSSGMKVFTQVKAHRQGLCLAGTDSVHQESCLGREEEARLGEDGGC